MHKYREGRMKQKGREAEKHRDGERKKRENKEKLILP